MIGKPLFSRAPRACFAFFVLAVAAIAFCSMGVQSAWADERPTVTVVAQELLPDGTVVAPQSEYDVPLEAAAGVSNSSDRIYPDGSYPATATSQVSEDGYIWTTADDFRRAHMESLTVRRDSTGDEVTFGPWASNDEYDAWWYSDAFPRTIQLGDMAIETGGRSNESANHNSFAFYKITDSLTVTYTYRTDPVHDVSFVAGTTPLGTYHRVEGDKVTFPTPPAVPGKTLDDHWKSEDTQVMVGSSGNSIDTPDHDTTFTIAYLDRSYALTYDLAGGSLNGSDAVAGKTVSYTETGLIPEGTPTREGYTFEGWKVGDTAITAESTVESLALADDVDALTIVAQWKAKAIEDKPEGSTPPAVNPTTPNNPSTPDAPSGEDNVAKTELPQTSDTVLPFVVVGIVVVAAAGCALALYSQRRARQRR